MQRSTESRHIDRWLCCIQAACNLKPRDFCLVTGCPRSGTTAMIDWLRTEQRMACFAESRILIAGHYFMTQVNRFRSLDGSRRDVAIRSLRQLVNRYYATHALVWKRVLVDKEPLGPINLPDGDYSAFIDNVGVIFPASKVLILVRDPLATVSSMMNRRWGYSLRSGTVGDMSIDKAIETWNSCADIALSHHGKPTTHVCRFENLISHPERESRKIWQFLSIDTNRVFEPRTTGETGLSASQSDYVLSRTSERHRLLVQVFAG
jgi:Sulfotransferase family